MIDDMPSAPHDPDSLVTTFIECIQGHRLAAALELVADDCEYDNVPITKVFGKPAIEQILSGFWPSVRQLNGSSITRLRVVI